MVSVLLAQSGLDEVDIVPSFINKAYFPPFYNHVIILINLRPHERDAIDFKHKFWFCPGVPVNNGITIVLPLFRSHWFAVVYCLVFCIGSCVPVHEDRT